MISYKDYILSINEGLIKTYPSKVVSNALSNYLLDLNIFFDIETLEDKFLLKLNFFNSIPASNLDDLFNIIDIVVINNGGWFPSSMNIENVWGMKNILKYDLSNLYLNHRVYNKVEILYESKFDKKVKIIPNELYHLSIYEYRKKILKYGLCPKSKDKLSSHLDRIYLCGDVNDCKALINRMNLYYNDEKSFNIYNKEKRKFNKNTIPIIFKIDNTNSCIKTLYKDPNYDRGYYTLDNIPPNKISIIDFK